MDVDHVAFAGLRKFDGHRPRRLTARRDRRRSPAAPGAACATAPSAPPASCQPLPDELVDAVEAHSFEPLAQLCWRNSDAGFQPRRRAARQPDRAAARARPGARQRRRRPGDPGRAGARAGDPRAWPRAGAGCGCCGTPARSPTSASWPTTPTPGCAPACSATSRSDGTLPTDWLAGQIAALDRTDGDIDTLMQRLAGVRVWSYIAARADWVRDAAALAGPRPRGRGPAVRRAARAADQRASSIAAPRT